MHSAVHKTNSRKLLVLGILVAAAAIAYLFVDVSFSNERLFLRIGSQVFCHFFYYKKHGDTEFFKQ